ncbi:MAG: hypothetical protein ACI39H_09125 [Lachnospiraceae bacterium]
MAKLVYQRKNGKWEARYRRGISESGKTLYGTVYGDTKEEAIKRRMETLGYDPDQPRIATQLNLLILGAGTHGRDIMDIAQSLNVFRKIHFLDDYITGEDIIGRCKDVLRYKSEYPCAFVAIGDCEKRKKYATLIKEQGFLIPNIVSHAATISPKATLGEGVAIMPQCTVGEAVIGDFCILASNALVNSGAKVGNYSRLDCGGMILKNIHVPDETWIQSGEIYGK